MVVNSPEVRDDTIQLFSEPLPTGAGPGTSHSMAVPSAEGTTAAEGIVSGRIPETDREREERIQRKDRRPYTVGK